MAHSFNIVTKEVQVGDATIQFETGRMAKQAGGSVLITMGETVLLVVATSAKDARPGQSFFPLTCDYVEKSYAAGNIPGNYFRREGRQNEFEVLASRLMDRPIRPLFPKGFMCETQVIATVLSHDQKHDSQVLALIGSSAALSLSDIPFHGPTAAVRVIRHNGELVANPTLDLIPEGDLDILVAVSPDGICMVEGGAGFVGEDVILDALMLAQTTCEPIIQTIKELAEAAGKPKREVEPPTVDEGLKARVNELAAEELGVALTVPEKLPRYAALDVAKANLKAQFSAEELEEKGGEISEHFSGLKASIVRGRILNDGVRIDKRGIKDIRAISTETTVLPRTHGSALFTRGETQALATVTLGTGRDPQRIETLMGEVNKSFMLHYNFPPFSVGETKFLRGPGRREIGHGTLAQRGITPLLPSDESFPYAIRIVSEVLESNGSSSMATVCAGSMALMDAGVPISGPVAGIAMGLIKEGDDIAILSDILGDEDHLGDLDFKVVGNRDGISAIQMDMKITGLTRDVLAQALEQAREGRLHILDEMGKTIEESRLDLSTHAPRIFTISINPEKIRDLIGPGGKHIRSIQADTGATIDVNDEGRVNVAASDGEVAKQAIELVRRFTEEPELNKRYLGVVSRIADFGAFVEILPGTDGLVHISELAEDRIDRVEDVCAHGDEILVKCIGIDRQGKVRLSRRAVLIEEAGGTYEAPSRERPSGGGDRDRGGGGGDRGGRDRGRRFDN
jgi:polyribonucleotide nucleotidyltransferase